MIPCMFCSGPLYQGDDVVKVSVGSFVGGSGFEPALFPDGAGEKFGHTKCLAVKFSPVGDAANNEFCPYCNCRLVGAAFAFILGTVIDGAYFSRRLPVFVCARCGIDSLGEGRMEEAEKILGFRQPGAFELDQS